MERIINSSSIVDPDEEIGVILVLDIIAFYVL